MTDCLLVQMPVVKDFWEVDDLSIILAILIGAIVGALIALGCSKLCIRDLMRKKTQDVESSYMDSKGYAPHQKEKLITQQSSTKKRPRTSKKKRLQSAKKKGGQEPLVPITPIILEAAPTQPAQGIVQSTKGGGEAKNEETEGGNTRGIADALVLPNGAAMEAEISNQDMDAINNLEKELREENLNTMMQLLRTLLNQQLSKGKITPEQYKDLMKQYQDNMEDAIRTNQREQEEEEEDLRKKHKDPVQLQRELDKLHPKYVQRLNTLVQDEKEKFRQRLGNQTELSEAEIDAIMANLAENMARLENKLGVERTRQAANLEERLARRRQLAEYNQAEKQQEKKDAIQRVEVKNNLLTNIVNDGKINERQKQELLDQYDKDQHRIQMKHEEEMQRQKLALAEKLRRNREEKMQRLEKAHDKQREDFSTQTDQNTNPKEMTEAYHNLLQQQRQEHKEMVDELDQVEADEFNRLIKDVNREKEEELAEQENGFQEQLQTKAQLSEREAEKIMRGYEAEMDQYEKQKHAEKKRMKAMMEEKLQQRRLKAEEESKKALAEQKALKEQQDVTIQKVLQSQVELSDDAKKKILQEHDQNMTAINNQLQMSKLRQQKAMEQKINARKAKVADLKQQAEDAKMARRDMKEKDREKLQQQLQKQIEAEEKRLKEEHDAELQELRDRLSTETNEALMEQERQLGLLIARLQVGQARRLAIIQKQDKTIKELEEQLAKKVSAEEGSRPSSGNSDQVVDALINQHHSEVMQLQDRMQEAKDRQEQLLQEKLQAKKLKKEREVERKLEDDAQKDWEQQQKRGAGVATSILSQTMLEQRHKMSMKQLEHEMQVEMQKQREQLNQELEMELQEELEERKKSFLAQLAVIGHVSKEEMNELVDNAVIDSGGTSKEAKKLAKEMNKELKRAKSDLAGLDNDGYGRRPGYRRTRSNMDGYDNYGYQQHQDTGYDEVDYHRRSSIHQRPRSAYKHVTYQDEDDY